MIEKVATDSRSYRVNTVNNRPTGAERQYLMAKRISAGCERLGFSVLVGQFSRSRSPPHIPFLGFMDREVSIKLHRSLDAGWKCVFGCEQEDGCEGFSRLILMVHFYLRLESRYLMPQFNSSKY